eukprot:12263062-Heterocapsa_arctica.AAC.1
MYFRHHDFPTHAACVEECPFEVLLYHAIRWAGDFPPNKGGMREGMGDLVWASLLGGESSGTGGFQPANQLVGAVTHGLMHHNRR